MSNDILEAIRENSAEILSRPQTMIERISHKRVIELTTSSRAFSQKELIFLATMLETGCRGIGNNQRAWLNDLSLRVPESVYNKHTCGFKGLRGSFKFCPGCGEEL